MRREFEICQRPTSEVRADFDSVSVVQNVEIGRLVRANSAANLVHLRGKILHPILVPGI